MSTRIGFFGTECYDLILYCARILKNCGKSVMIVDSTDDGSLISAVPPVKGVENEVLDYRGLHCFTHEIEYMDMDYDVAVLYYGFNYECFTKVNYAFLVTDCQLHNIEKCKRIVNVIPEFVDSVQEDESEDERELLDTNVFESGMLNLLILGADATGRQRFICSQLGLEAEQCHAVWLDDGDYTARISCQYDAVFRFAKISPEYKDLIDKICYTVLGDDITIKEYRKARQKAERGK